MSGDDLITYLAVPAGSIPMLLACFVMIPWLFQVKGRRKLSGYGWGIALAMIWVTITILFMSTVLYPRFFSFYLGIVGWLWVSLFIAFVFPALSLFLPQRQQCPSCSTYSPLDATYCYNCMFLLDGKPQRNWFSSIHQKLQPFYWLIVAGCCLLPSAVFGSLFIAPSPAQNPSLAENSRFDVFVAPTPLPTPELTDIVIAVQSIPFGSRIPESAGRIQPWPLEAAPFNAIHNSLEVVDKVALVDIYVGQPILSHMIGSDILNEEDFKSHPNAVVPRGVLLRNEWVTGPRSPNTTEEWVLMGEAGESIQLTVSSGYYNNTVLMTVWEQETENWLEPVEVNPIWITTSLLGEDWDVTYRFELPVTGVYNIMLLCSAPFAEHFSCDYYELLSTTWNQQVFAQQQLNPVLLPTPTPIRGGLAPVSTTHTPTSPPIFPISTPKP